MRKVREALRLRYTMGLSTREIGRSVGMGKTTVEELLRRAELAGIRWPVPEELDDVALEARLYPGEPRGLPSRPEPDWRAVHLELRKRKDVTLELLWLEYRRDHPDGYSYSHFCARYRAWAETVDPVMRQTYRAGEKMLVDYPGDTLSLVDPKSGEVAPVYLFVATLGASDYTYLEPQRAQDLAAWIGGHVRAFEYFRGVPRILVPDNAKVAVRRPDRYEPELNRTYQEMAAYYSAAIVPARPRRPRDKARVEQMVQMAERWVIAPLRHRIFFSFEELEEAVAELREALNDRPFQKLEGTRRQLYLEMDKPALQPLPDRPYEFALWKVARVGIDYCIEVEGNYYSAPYTLIHQTVDVRMSAAVVEIYHQGRRVGLHPRLFGRGRFHIDPAHQPPAHRAYSEWTPERMVRWAEGIGSKTALFVQAILEQYPHPELGCRSCLGVLRLGKQYPRERMEAAAERALQARALGYRHLRSILEKGLDRLPLEPESIRVPVPEHANVRGAGYYASKEGDEPC